MKVKELLKEVKANRYTYYNLDKETIKQYQKLYNYLKRHKEKKINKLLFLWGLEGENTNFYIEYVRKYKIMQLISQTIKH
jgi:ubiquitin